MIIQFDANYTKAYRKRIRNNRNLRIRTAERIKLFVTDSHNPVLKDHQLSGNQKKNRAFWITGDIRIIYFLISKNEVLFLDIGTHNQVY